MLAQAGTRVKGAAFIFRQRMSPSLRPMRVKLYRASEIGAAMARIRAELGPDALILSTRKLAEGVEVTAALETPDPVPAERTGPSRAELLAWHGVPSLLAAALADGNLAVALGAALRFGALPLDSAASPLLLIGPPGAGKTLTVARLATRLVLAGVTPRIITADGERAGAVEQLAAFTRLLGLDLLAASTEAAFVRALARARDGAGAAGPVVIDTPGLDPFARTGRASLVALIGAAAGHVALVLPAGLDAAEAADLAASCAEAGATYLIATRLDLARRLGGVLAAADAGGLILAEAGIGPGAADGLVALTPALLAGLLGRGSPDPRSPAPPRPPSPPPRPPAAAPRPEAALARPVWPKRDAAPRPPAPSPGPRP